MPITTAPPLLVALGARIFLNTFVFHNELPSASDFLLHGLFQGILLYHALTELPQLVVPIAVGIGAKLVYDYLATPDSARCVFTIVGIALGILATDMLSRLFENGVYVPNERERTTSTSHARDAYEPSKRLRLVSFSRSEAPDRTRRHRHSGDDERERRARPEEARPITPALTYASTAPSISLESVPSSIDPEGKMTPQERAIAILRARASLADSERRRFKEERKWALAQGNMARASQLAWQVKRFAALMESFHREADAKIVEAARSAERQSSVQLPSGAGGSSSRREPETRRRTTSASNSARAQAAEPQDRAPLVSVTVGSSRPRKRSSGASSLRPAIRVSGRDVNVTTR